MHLFFSSYSPVKPGLNGPEAASPPLPVVNCQTCVVDDGITKDIIFQCVKTHLFNQSQSIS